MPSEAWAMTETFITPTTRVRRAAFHRPARRVWIGAAALFTALAHVYVGWKLMHMQPDPLVLPARGAPPELVYQFDPLPPPEVTPAPAAPEVHRPPEKPRLRPLVKPTRRPQLRTQTAETPAQLPDATGLRAQIGQLAPEDSWETVPEAGPPDLDLRIQAQPSTGRRLVEGAAAMLGSPTRAALTPVGDIHSAMLFNKWDQQHHGALFRGCKKRDPSESVASFLDRCPPN